MKVFISYSRRNRVRSLRLAQALLHHGIDVWYDEWELLVGYPLLDSIYDGIRSCDYLAVILTKQSVKSRWVREELSYGKQDELTKSRVKILPLLYEKCEIPATLQGKVYADFTNSFEKGLQGVLRILGVPQSGPTEVKLTDNDIKKLFAELASGNHQEALNAARQLSEFRDPEAKKVLLSKLQGTAYERHIAVLGLVNYASEDIVGPLLCSIPADMVIADYVGNKHETAMMLKTIQLTIRYLSNFLSNLPVLYLWGSYLVSTLNPNPLPDSVAAIMRTESIRGFRKIGAKTLASVFIRLFGYNYAVKGVERVLPLVPEKDSEFLDTLLTETHSQKLAAMAFPEGGKTVERFRLSGVEEGIYQSFDEDEFKLLRKRFKKHLSDSSRDAPMPVRAAASLFAAGKEMYGFFPDDDAESSESKKLIAKLQLFLRLYEREKYPVPRKEFEKLLSGKEPRSALRLLRDLVEFLRTRCPTAAVEFMMGEEI